MCVLRFQAGLAQSGAENVPLSLGRRDLREKYYRGAISSRHKAIKTDVECNKAGCLSLETADWTETKCWRW